MTNKITVTPDYTRYYSEKSKEWAISDEKVDNTDYSSKYYANESKKQANIATAKTTEVIASGNTAVSNIESARNNAITDIINQENLSVDNVNTAGATQVANVNSAGTTQVNLAKEQVTIATNQATIATNKTSEVVASGNEALSNINTAKTGALTDITDLKNTSVSNITTAKNSAITSITTQETTSKNNVIATGNAQVERVNLTGVDNKTPIFSKSEIGTNESVYQNIYDLKHSTFDKSKFTVVGSPTITDDGVASGFSQNNRLEIPFNSTGKTNFKIKVPFKFPTTMALGGNIIWGDIGISSYCYGKKSYQPSLLGTGVTAFGGSEDLQANIDYILEMSVENTNSCKFEIKRIDTNVVVATKSWTTERNVEISKIYISQLSNLAIDLKQFSITVDSKEVFNGNKTGLDVINEIEIPYTLSKTGSKIVDVAYRDRVIDLYEQEGQAGYYTIDEPNKNFTLPMGEIYGMIGQRSLISSIVTETNRVDIYSDKTCLICGNVATAGTINLPIELVNNNYFITLPTSAKTATSFTTTSTCDYILIGKVA